MDRMDILKQAVEGALKDAGVPLNNAQQELQTFYTRIEQPYLEAVATGDDLSLRSFQDRVNLMTGRVSFKTIHRYRQVVNTTILTVLRVLVALK